MLSWHDLQTMTFPIKLHVIAALPIHGDKTVGGTYVIYVNNEY